MGKQRGVRVRLAVQAFPFSHTRAGRHSRHRRFPGDLLSLRIRMGAWRSRGDNVLRTEWFSDHLVTAEREWKIWGRFAQGVLSAPCSAHLPGLLRLLGGARFLIATQR